MGRYCDQVCKKIVTLSSQATNQDRFIQPVKNAVSPIVNDFTLACQTGYFTHSKKNRHNDSVAQVQSKGRLRI